MFSRIQEDILVALNKSSTRIASSNTLFMHIYLPFWQYMFLVGDSKKEFFIHV